VERIERLRKQRTIARVERALKIGREFAAMPVLDSRTPDEMLYDEHGLPK
jgi:hypothetical protein